MHPNAPAIRRFADPVRLARSLADDLSESLRERPALVLGLPTGRSPLPLYAELVARHRRGLIDFSRATTFNLDEFVGIGPRDHRSYRMFMEEALFRHVNLDRRRIRFLDGTAPRAGEECDRYERRIARAGGIDLLLLGLGVNGHIGFNEPGPSLVSRTHVATLAYSTRVANAGLFGGRVSMVPSEALSMGMGTILRARRIVLLATGSTKAGAVRDLVRGPVTTRMPASFLQLHAKAELWVDAAAAANL